MKKHYLLSSIFFLVLLASCNMGNSKLFADGDSDDEDMSSANKKTIPELLQEKGLQGDELQDKLNSSPINLLGWAIEKGHTDVVRKLVQQGVDLNARIRLIHYTHTMSEVTPLGTAVFCQNIEIVKLLLSQVKRIDLQAGYGRQTLLGCGRKNYWDSLMRGADIARLLLDRHEDIVLDDYQDIPILLGYAAQYNHPACSDLLNRAIKQGVGAAALAAIAEKGYSELLEKTLKLDGVEKASLDLSEPLIKASEGGHLDVVKMLLKKGIDPNKKAYGTTALIKAASGVNIHDRSMEARKLLDNREKVVICLLEHGADPDIQNTWGNTALMEVIDGGFLGETKRKKKLCGVLIEATKDLHLTNNQGQNALDIAEEKFERAKPVDKENYGLIIAMIKKKM